MSRSRKLFFSLMAFIGAAAIIGPFALGRAGLSLPGFDMQEEKQPHLEQQKIVVTKPLAKDVTITRQYVCRIRPQRYIEVRALAGRVSRADPSSPEGQTVKAGDVMFEIVPTLYQAKLEAELGRNWRSRSRSSITPIGCSSLKVIAQDSSWHCGRPNWPRPTAKADLAKAEF